MLQNKSAMHNFAEVQKKKKISDIFLMVQFINWRLILQFSSFM